MNDKVKGRVVMILSVVALIFLFFGWGLRRNYPAKRGWPWIRRLSVWSWKKKMPN